MGEHEPLIQQIDAALTPEADKDSRVVIVNGDLLTIDGRRYRLVKDHRNAFDVARLNERYNEILDKYDYIVGDWGYDQLRLRGFYKDDRRGVSKDQLIGTLEDYLYEYCNFGCAYFVLACLDKSVTKGQPHRRQGHREAGQRSETIKPVHRQTPPTNRRNSQNNKHKPRSANAEKPYTEKTTRPTKIRGDQAKTINQTQPRKRHFTIRRRETNKK
ncbi:YutD family protein [Lacticaseibacillus paracasei]